jgi:hypothetical protein
LAADALLARSLWFQQPLDALDHEAHLFSLLLYLGQWSALPTLLPTIGIRHGDPLFPIIFVLMEEGLGHYLKASVLDGSLKGLPLQNIQPAPSHSEFFYETLLLNNLRAQETAKLNFILIDFVYA